MTDACALPDRPRRLLWWIVAALFVAGAVALDWNLGALSSWANLYAALDRVATYVAAFTSPDLSAAMLGKCAKLAVETLAIAFLGVAVGLVLGYPLALGATRCLVRGEDPAHPLVRALQRVVLELSRFALDVLRGVPDIAWAIVLANLTGVNATTGVLAIGVSVAGIFGKVLSEQWDNVDPVRYAALRSTGAPRSAVFLYGVQPLAARTMLSFLLMRTECAVRNASVIGVVGGGGLGAQLWDEYTDGNWPAVATVLLALLAVTATTDLLANVIRQRLRVDPNHPRAHDAVDRGAQARRRWQALAVALVLVAASAAWLAPALASAWSELGRIDWDFAGPYTFGLFVPDLSASTVTAALGHSVVPLSIGVLSTVLAALGAAALAYPASVAFQLDAHRFVGENLPAWRRRGRWALARGRVGHAAVGVLPAGRDAVRDRCRDPQLRRAASCVH
jgi:phosphonate transport system permease protein